MNEIEYIDIEVEGNETTYTNSSGQVIDKNQSFTENPTAYLSLFFYLIIILLIIAFIKKLLNKNTYSNIDVDEITINEKKINDNNIDYEYTYNVNE